MLMKSVLSNPVWVFCISIFFGYGIVAGFALWETGSYYYSELIVLSTLSLVTIALFSRVAWFGEGFRLRRIPLAREHFLIAVFLCFGSVAAYIIATAPGIPLLAWASGADPADLVVMREEFLKARTGAEAALPYINSILAGVFVPYALAEMFLCKHRWRWFCFIGFLIYCVLFIEKVYFLKAMVPLAVVLIFFSEYRIRKLLPLFLVSAILLYGLAVVSGFGEGEDGFLRQDYFSNAYRPTGALGYLFWRAIAVPVFTAADTLSYFDEILGSTPLFGASSGTLATLLGSERVYLERDVFAYQWGQTETGTGSANSVFFVDAYANFGYAGVIFYSAGVALVLRYFAKTRDRSLYCLWPLLAFGFYVSGFVGNLLSGGFLMIILFSMVVKLVDPDDRRSMRENSKRSHRLEAPRSGLVAGLGKQSSRGSR